jgi:hypothetical protein
MLRLALVALAALLSVAAASGGPLPTPPPPVAPGPYPAFPTSCFVNVRLFRSLRTGPIDYCRENLRYEPGALECYQFTDQVCTVFLPSTGGFTETRSLLHAIPFRCPDGPEPPVCPRLSVR